MNPQIMQLRIELSKTEHEFSEQEIKMKRLFWELQTLANPYYKSVEEIKAKEIEQCADDMLATKDELLKLQTKINDLKGQLGVE